MAMLADVKMTPELVLCSYGETQGLNGRRGDEHEDD